jgi:hypothetical protein
MGVRGSFAALCLALGAGCAGQTGIDDAPGEAPALDETLDMTVDALDVVHGALRIRATMVDGAADVSVRLAGDCEHREVGGGTSTRSTFVWALDEKEVADAIACGLLVCAQGRDGAHQVHKLAQLGVEVGVEPLNDEPAADEDPSVFPLSSSELAGSVVRAEPLVRGRRSFATSIAVGGTSLQVDAQEIDEVLEELPVQE